MTAPRFHISSYCGATAACVAVAASEDDAIVVRDDKIDGGAVLTFTADEWDAFVAGVKDGEFDRPRLRSLAHVE